MMAPLVTSRRANALPDGHRRRYGGHSRVWAARGRGPDPERRREHQTCGGQLHTDPGGCLPRTGASLWSWIYLEIPRSGPRLALRALLTAFVRDANALIRPRKTIQENTNARVGTSDPGVLQSVDSIRRRVGPGVLARVTVTMGEPAGSCEWVQATKSDSQFP